MAKIADIEGIGSVFATKLEAAGIATTEALLSTGASTQGRKDIAAKTGIADGLILKWVNHADLFRVKGIASQYAELLEAAGVDTVVELAQRRSDNLFKAVTETNALKNLVRVLPSESQISDWIAQAKALPRGVSH